MTTTTIRVSKRARDLLQELARTSGTSMQHVLEEALEYYHRDKILAATNAAYAALQENKKAWVELEQERREWDQTLADGLEKEA